MYRNNNAAGCGPSFDRSRFRNHFQDFHSHRMAMHKAPVSIYKTEQTYEILVFAPGRVKEQFHIQVNDRELKVSYTPVTNTSGLDWVLKEYSRGGFERSFLVDDHIDTGNIAAKYEDGVLQLSLAIKPGTEQESRNIEVN